MHSSSYFLRLLARTILPLLFVLSATKVNGPWLRLPEWLEGYTGMLQSHFACLDCCYSPVLWVPQPLWLPKKPSICFSFAWYTYKKLDWEGTHPFPVSCDHALRGKKWVNARPKLVLTLLPFNACSILCGLLQNTGQFNTAATIAVDTVHWMWNVSAASISTRRLVLVRSAAAPHSNRFPQSLGFGKVGMHRQPAKGSLAALTKTNILDKMCCSDDPFSVVSDHFEPLSHPQGLPCELWS